MSNIKRGKNTPNEIVDIDKDSVGIVTTHCGKDRIYIIDREDLPRVKNIKWTSSTSFGLAYCRGTLRDQLKIRLHRLILSFPDGLVDHIDLDTCNNRKSNLRVANHAENKRNQPARKQNKFGVKGVHKRGNRYRSIICVNGRNKILGNFDLLKDAAIAYNNAAIEYFGEFAFLNDIDSIHC